MAVIPRFLTVEQRIALLGPTIPAPERYIDEQGFLRYSVGDPVPVGIARALGWMDPIPEPEMPRARNRGRTVRAADREADQSGTVQA